MLAITYSFGHVATRKLPSIESILSLAHGGHWQEQSGQLNLIVHIFYGYISAYLSYMISFAVLPGVAVCLLKGVLICCPLFYTLSKYEFGCMLTKNYLITCLMLSKKLLQRFIRNFS